jgi:hypothetical protein
MSSAATLPPPSSCQCCLSSFQPPRSTTTIWWHRRAVQRQRVGVTCRGDVQFQLWDGRGRPSARTSLIPTCAAASSGKASTLTTTNVPELFDMPRRPSPRSTVSKPQSMHALSSSSSSTSQARISPLPPRSTPGIDAIVPLIIINPPHLAAPIIMYILFSPPRTMGIASSRPP